MLWALTECSLSSLWVLSECSLSSRLTLDWQLADCLTIWVRNVKREHFVTDRQTDRRTEKVTPRAPVGAKNYKEIIKIDGEPRVNLCFIVNVIPILVFYCLFSTHITSKILCVVFELCIQFKYIDRLCLSKSNSKCPNFKPS